MRNRTHDVFSDSLSSCLTFQITSRTGSSRLTSVTDMVGSEGWTNFIWINSENGISPTADPMWSTRWLLGENDEEEKNRDDSFFYSHFQISVNKLRSGHFTLDGQLDLGASLRKRSNHFDHNFRLKVYNQVLQTIFLTKAFIHYCRAELHKKAIFDFWILSKTSSIGTH